MALRTKLDELGKMEGIAHAEKGQLDVAVKQLNVVLLRLFPTDPEEFLNMLFKHTLKVDPFLTIRFVCLHACEM